MQINTSVNNFVKLSESKTKKSSSPGKLNTEAKTKTAVESEKSPDSVQIRMSAGGSHRGSVLEHEISKEEIDEYSEKALLINETRYLSDAARLATKTGMALAGIGIAGSVGMTSYCIYGLATAKTGAEKIDYASGAGWGIQSGLLLADEIGHFSKAAGRAITLTASSIGVVGGSIDTLVGIKELREGIKTKNKKKKITGLLDVGIGLSWIASSTVLTGPLGSALFLGGALAKMAYRNKASFKKRFNMLSDRVKGFFGMKAKEAGRKIPSESSVNTAAKVPIVRVNADKSIVVKTPEAVVKLVPEGNNPPGSQKWHKIGSVSVNEQSGENRD